MVCVCGSETHMYVMPHKNNFTNIVVCVCVCAYVRVCLFVCMFMCVDAHVCAVDICVAMVSWKQWSGEVIV